jgi:hypothetical protein
MSSTPACVERSPSMNDSIAISGMRRSMPMTSAPSCAASSAVRAPIPEEIPVMTMVFP